MLSWSNPEREKSRFRILILFISVLFALLVYLPGLNGPFLFDDRANILLNTSVHLKELTFDNVAYAAYSFQAGGGSRPLSMISFAFDYWRGGLDPFFFKSTNLLLHLVTALVFMKLLAKILGQMGWGRNAAMWGGLQGAMLWAVHPIQVSSVLYVVQRMQILAALFMALAIYFYLKARLEACKPRIVRQNLLFVFLCGLLSWASKEDAVLLPCFLILVEIFVCRFRPDALFKAQTIRKALVFSLFSGGVVYFAWVVPHFWVWADYPGRSFSSYERLLTQGRVLALYLMQVFYPALDGMRFYYDDFHASSGIWSPPETLICLIFIAGLLMVAVFLRAKRPLCSLGIFWFFAAHFLTSNVIGLELVFEHRNYFALIGVVLVVIDFTNIFSGDGTKKTGVAFVVLFFWGGLTVQRAEIWSDINSFGKYAVKVAPQSARAWLTLCSAYFEQSRTGGAEYILRAIEVCREGAEKTGAPTLVYNQIVFKSKLGLDTEGEWGLLFARLGDSLMSVENKAVIWMMMHAVENGNPNLDVRHVRKAIKIATARSFFSVREYLEIAQFMIFYGGDEAIAYDCLVRAINISRPGDVDIKQMLKEIGAGGFSEWGRQLQDIASSTGKI